MTETPNPQGKPQDGPHVGAEQPTYEQQQSPQPGYQQPSYQQAPYQPYQQPYGYAPVPGTETQTDRNWAAASHWGTLVAAWLAMGFLAPLVIMLTVGNQSAYVRRHAVESLNFQISLLIYSAAAVLFSIVTIGLGLLVVLPVGLVAAIAALVFIIVASVRATNGEDYRYPLTLRFVR
jgi:uncharacterized Tic20 family protein